MTTATLDAAARETFAGCASFYDSLTAHHDYELLTSVLEQLLEEHGHPGKRMLDVACGTGKSFLPFLLRGYDVTACDISPEMLDHARVKAEGAAELLLADMRSLPALGSFDLVTCIDEPINYLLETDEVEGCLASLARNLRPGGIVVFDLNTLHTFRSIFARDECYEQEGWLFVWRGHGDGTAEPGARSGFTLEAFTEDGSGSWTRLTNQHLQRHYPSDEVPALLADAGLDCVGVYGLFPDGSLDRSPDEDRHTKLIYLASKPTGTTRR